MRVGVAAELWEAGFLPQAFLPAQLLELHLREPS